MSFLKKLSVFAFILMLISCSADKQTAQTGEDGFVIEDQVVDETSYQTLENDQQAQALSEEEKNLAIAQTQEASPQQVEVKDRVLFEYDSASISEESAKILDTQIDWLKSDPQIKVTIEGHCDERGTREYNIALGEKRAVAVKKYLEKGGIETSRLKVISYGKERPAFFGTSQEIHAKNRRAVVVVN